MNRFRALFQKEVRENLRDRRAIAMALLFPIIGPLILVVLVSTVARTTRGEIDAPVPIAIAGGDRAPNLVAFLVSNGARVSEAPADVERAVREGRLNVALVIPAEHEARLRDGRPAPVRLVVDDSRQSAQPQVMRARALLEGWSRQVGSLRLVARGIHPSVPEALAVETVDVATPESRAAVLLAVMPYFVVLALLLGGMYVAIDATAGERERQSLEPLLLNPVPRSHFVAAKVLATMTFAGAALLETLAGFALVPLLLPISTLGFSMRLDPGVLLRVGLLVLPLLALAASLQVLVAAQARSFKAAQASLSLMTMLPVLPGMVLAFAPAPDSPALMLVPTMAEQVLMQRLIRGQPIPFEYPIIAAAASLSLAAVAFWAAVRWFKSEKLLFGR
ncbi:MAG TPA: ABC transporter permease subunit [Anaeromyxobacteraceae bacterium]|nr:ABC transporter permease subunit [Anaeromyxobacteraceae bacterium]